MKFSGKSAGDLPQTSHLEALGAVVPANGPVIIIKGLSG
jgi:hypothetical protein